MATMKDRGYWQLRIFHEVPAFLKDANGLAAADMDGDGKVEVVVGGNGGLFWYRPASEDRGVICEGGVFSVEMRLEDLDGDGFLEVVVSHEPVANQGSSLVWLKPEGSMDGPWRRHVIDPRGGGHDVLFADIDGDGERELLAHNGRRGTAIYKRQADLAAPWRRHDLNTQVFREGLAAADLDGDGRIEVLHGGDLFRQPEGGPFAGEWHRQPYAPSFREMCRVALVDITGTGRPDVVLVESEFMEGRMSWFENRMAEDPEKAWVEHPINSLLVYAHSLEAWRQGGETKLMVAEMEKGGWDAPYNFHARVIQYTSQDCGQTWCSGLISRGSGTHQATVCDLDGDGELEVVGKECCQRPELGQPKIQIWKRQDDAPSLARFRHRFIDRDKPQTATDILAADLDGDGVAEVVCGSWWYRPDTGAHPWTWERHDIPGVNQVHCAYDIDGDGRPELIATTGRPGQSGYGALTSELCWAKPLDPGSGQWEVHPIGTGQGDWPHGTLVAPLLPGGRLALVAGYHNAAGGVAPELFVVPDDPRKTPWPRRTLAEIAYGEEFAACDVDGDGKLDLIAGPYWLENLGDGTFAPHRIVEGFPVARVAVVDINGDGRPDVVLGGEVLDFTNRVTPYSKLAWFENPPDPRADGWTMHPIDTMRCPHSVGVGDLDGDGEVEIVAGEHDPFWPYRSQCRLYAYKKADPLGRSWLRWTLDDRFEHHDGVKVVELGLGRPAIVSHGWTDGIYVNLWEQE